MKYFKHLETQIIYGFDEETQQDLIQNSYDNLNEWVEIFSVATQIEVQEVEKIVVSPWQIRKALNQLNLRNDVEYIINNKDQSAKDGWEYATSWEESHPLILEIAKELELTNNQLHSIFLLAKDL